ncbi:hypothetical protein ACFL3U_02075 [Pseudomonadota bacterium]
MKFTSGILITLLFGCMTFPAWGEGMNAEAVEELDEQELILEDDELLIEEGADSTVIDIEDDVAADEVLMEEGGVATEDDTDITYSDNVALQAANFSMGIDETQIEAGHLIKSGAEADTSNYLHMAFSARWDSGSAWEAQLAGRVDGYYQSGKQNPDRTQLDYGESFIRYRGEDVRFTVGTQMILWGRIDELPPTDRLSTVDLSRFILDDHPDRRRASPAIRLEYFRGADKFDVVWLPKFRAAKLAGRKSIWSSINQQKGELLGVESTPAVSALIKGSRFTEHEPHGDGGGGVRYSHSGSGFDYALTAQHVRQSTPYYELVSANRFKAHYPRSWVVGGDIGFEALDAAWSFEAAWLSDVPVTKTDISYTTIEGVSWAASVEFHPGDGDTRVNLQLIGTNLIDSPRVLDRTEIYTINGAVDFPFARERWRVNTRFFLGLDKKDVYINPELAYIGWEPHEIYLAAHYFTGSGGTLGGYHQDHSLLTLGWRAKF